MKTPMLRLIKFYRNWISPALPGSCRFAPSCSAYAHEAIEQHGPLKGALLAAGRLTRCHPLNSGGYDPVPEKRVSECRGAVVSGTKLEQSEQHGTLNA
jgi:putative membrane protein insertion efficiency factor